MGYLTEGVYYDTLELPTHCLGQRVPGDQRPAHPLAGALLVDPGTYGLVAGAVEATGGL
jgi:hypothetical protein